jgi:hypothetical protein
VVVASLIVSLIADIFLVGYASKLSYIYFPSVSVSFTPQSLLVHLLLSPL